MDFFDLIKKHRGKDWQFPWTMLAIDPGETIGLAFLGHTEPTRVEQHRKGEEVYSFLNTVILNFKPKVIVCEDYKIYANKLKDHSLSNVPTVKIIGAIEMICKLEGIQLIMQMASTGKGFVTNEKLKEWGYYEEGKPHGMDALRHGLHALLFSKEL